MSALLNQPGERSRSKAGLWAVIGRYSALKEVWRPTKFVRKRVVVCTNGQARMLRLGVQANLEGTYCGTYLRTSKDSRQRSHWLTIIDPCLRGPCVSYLCSIQDSVGQWRYCVYALDLFSAFRGQRRGLRKRKASMAEPTSPRLVKVKVASVHTVKLSRERRGNLLAGLTPRAERDSTQLRHHQVFSSLKNQFLSRHSIGGAVKEGILRIKIFAKCGVCERL